MKRRNFLLKILVGASLASCGQVDRHIFTLSSKDKKPLEVWWEKPFYPEERDVVELIFQQAEKRTGVKANITFIMNDNRQALSKTHNQVLGDGFIPDIYYGGGSLKSLVPNLAKNNKILAIDDIILPLESKFVNGVINNVTYKDSDGLNEAIIAVPVSFNGVYIHYWKDLLAAINHLSKSPLIPTDWYGFWDFWKQSQRLAKEAGFNQTYGIGLPMSANTSDTGNIFNLFLEAYGVTIIDELGRLVLNQKDQRERAIKALTDYTSLYTEKYVPPDATQWTDADNNIRFLNYNTLMTANPTLSIPGSQALDETTYYKRMGSVTWPNGLDGKPLKSVLEVRQLVIFNNERSQQAKTLVNSMLQDSSFDKLIEGSQGRYLPVFKSAKESQFWNDKKDPHIMAAKKTVEFFRQPYAVKNKAYSEVIEKRVWSEAIEAVALSKVGVEVAVDQVIFRIEDILNQVS